MGIVNWMMTIHASIKFSKEIVNRNETSRMRGGKEQSGCERRAGIVLIHINSLHEGYKMRA